MGEDAIMQLSILLAEDAAENCAHLPGCRPCTRCLQQAIARAVRTADDHWRARIARIASELASAANR